MRDRAVVGHERRRPPVERLDDGLCQLGRPERGVGGDAHAPAEQKHLVMDAGELIEHAAERRRDRRVRVDHGARAVAPVDGQMEVELGGRLQVAVDDLAVEVDDAYPVRVQVREHAARGRDRDPVVAAGADVSRRAGDQPRRRQAPRRRGDLLPLPLEHGANAISGQPSAAYTRRMAVDRLSEEDARILALESPTIAGHMCKLLVLERPLTVEALRRHVSGRLAEAPRLGQRLAPTPLGIANHVRPVETETPVDRQELLQIAAELMAERLDRSRPLWRIDVVERLTGGRSALIWRVHHSMADGLTAFRLGSLAVWDDPAAGAGEESDEWLPVPSPRRLTLAALGARDRLAGLSGDAHRAARLVRSPRRLGSLARSAARMPAVVVRELRPGGAPTALDRAASSERVMACASAPLEELKRIEHAVGDGITVNDVVLAAVGGGLSRWLTHRGEALSGIRAKVPASLHRQHSAPDSLPRFTPLTRTPLGGDENGSLHEAGRSGRVRLVGCMREEREGR